MQKWTLGLALLGALSSGCTFYTSCPTGNANPTGNGGTSMGGTSSMSGASSMSGSGGMPSLPLVAWKNVTNNLAGLDSVCGNLTLVVAKPENVLLAGVAPNRLFASTDGGEIWNEIALGKGTETLSGGPNAITFDPTNSDTFWLATIYGDHGIWRTDDNGDTFKALGSIRHNDLLSVDFGDPDRQLMVAGGHETKNSLWRSVDGGENWDDIGASLPDDARPSDFPLVLDAERHLLGASAYGKGGQSGIFRTEDGGTSWDRVSSTGGFGKPLVLEDGTIYWMGDDGSLHRSTDDGLSWEEVLPKETIQGYQSLLQLPDGRLAILGKYTGIQVSDDGFATMTEVTQRLPWDTQLSNGFTYSEPNRAFYSWHTDCGLKVLDDAVVRADFDYAAK